MDYFAALKLFLRAADLGSFSRAAAAERCKVSTVSRAVQALEEDLGAALFDRSTRQLRPTEAGTIFRDRARHLLDELAEAREAIGTLSRAARGLLRLNLPTAFGRRHVLPLLGPLLEAHPGLDIEATLTDATVDLIAAGADVALRIGVLADSSLVARKLAVQRRVVCVAPELADRLQAPIAPEGLVGLPCLSIALQPTAHWFFLPRGGTETVEADWQPVAARGRLTVNDAEALRQAALDGLGIALLPTWLVGQDIAEGRLRLWLDGWRADIAAGPARVIAAVYPPKRIVSPKVRVFVDELAARFGSPPYWDEFETRRS